MKKGGSYIMENVSSAAAKNTCIIFSVGNSDTAGALAKSLRVFKDHDVNLIHIESRSSTRAPGYEFFVECDSSSGNLGQAIEELKQDCSYFSLISRDYKDNTAAVPWFPRRIRDLDRFANQILSYGADLDSDHPGFTDESYRKRRYGVSEFLNIHLNYRDSRTTLPYKTALSLISQSFLVD